MLDIAARPSEARAMVYRELRKFVSMESQGMEKSHHAAKASSQYHGQHGGTKNRTSIIVQQYEFWYRNIQHRYERKLQKKLGDAQRTVSDPLVIDAASQKRNSWYASNAAAACAHWREGRICLGRKLCSTRRGGNAADHGCI